MGDPSLYEESKWINVLEREFDKQCSSLQVKLKCEEIKSKIDLSPFEGGLSALTKLFTQLVLKTKTVLHANSRLKSTVEGIQAKLIQALTDCGRLEREVQARRLEVRSMEVQLSKEPDRRKELCVLKAELELELERYSQGEAREEQLNAELSTLRWLNGSLFHCVSSLHSGLAEATLIAKCTESELAGRVQQLQLLLNGVRGAELQKVWTQVMAGITVHRQKAVVRAYCNRPKSILCDPYKFLAEALQQRGSELKKVLLGCSPNTAAGDTLVLGKRRMVRTVTLTRRASEQLGISIVGGAELGVPILIAGLEEDKVAYACGDLQVGDAILSVNGESLQGRTHEEVVAMVGKEEAVVLEVMFAVGILELVSGKERMEGDATEKTQLSSPHNTSATDTQTSATVQPGDQITQQKEDKDGGAHEPPADPVPNRDDSHSEEIGVECALDSQNDKASAANVPTPVEDNTQKLSSAFQLEHSTSGFIPKDLEAMVLESTLFCYDQDPVLHVSPTPAAMPKEASPAALQASTTVAVNVSPVAAVSRRESESKLELCDDNAQLSKIPDSFQSLPSSMCPTTPMCQTTILSVQFLGNSADETDVPLFSLTL